MISCRIYAVVQFSRIELLDCRGLNLLHEKTLKIAAQANYDKWILNTQLLLLLTNIIGSCAILSVWMQPTWKHIENLTVKIGGICNFEESFWVDSHLKCEKVYINCKDKSIVQCDIFDIKWQWTLETYQGQPEIIRFYFYSLTFYQFIFFFFFVIIPVICNICKMTNYSSFLISGLKIV